MRISQSKLLVLLLVCAFSNSTFAAGWSGAATVEGIYALNDQQVLIKLSSFSNPGNCSVDGSGDVIINSVTHPNWFSMLLSAYTAGKKVDIFVLSGCTTVWSSSYANVGHVRLR